MSVLSLSICTKYLSRYLWSLYENNNLLWSNDFIYILVVIIYLYLPEFNWPTFIRIFPFCSNTSHPAKSMSMSLLRRYYQLSPTFNLFYLLFSLRIFLILGFTRREYYLYIGAIWNGPYSIYIFILIYIYIYIYYSLHYLGCSTHYYRIRKNKKPRQL